MDPDINTYNNQPISLRSRYLRKNWITIPVLVLLVGCGLYFAIHAIMPKKFSIVSTNPSTANIATVTPFFDIVFNKSLSKNGISLDATNSLIVSYSVSGKILNLNLHEPMNINQTYQITIKNISDTSGDHITNKVFLFSPKYTSAQDLPEDQQQALLKQQSVAPTSSVDNIYFAGVDSLLSYGLTTTQESSLEQEFFSFDPSASNITIDTGSISLAPYNPNSSNTTTSINFNVAVNSTSYKATVTYSNITSLELYLYNIKTNALVYESQGS
jgi:hypothetical protein